MKTVLVTGASRGIGKAIAEEFARNHYNIILNCYHSTDLLLAFANNLRSTYQIDCITCTGDIGNYDFVVTMFQQITARFGGIDVLINNAGISHIGLLSDMSIEDWNCLMNTNLTSVFSCCKHAIPYMLKKKCGKIINISSVWGSIGASCEVAYSASKGGMNAFTKGLAKELAPSGIAVNAIACGTIDTEMNACFSPEERQSLENEIPSGRYGTPKEVAELAYSLADGTPYLTGQIIHLDGGWI